MKIVFVHINMSTGGIETLLLRLSNYLVSHNHEVIVILKQGGELISQLDSRVRTIILGNNWRLMYIYPIRFLVLSSYIPVLSGARVFYSFGPESCLMASVMYKYFFPNTNVVFLNCLYHPHEIVLYPKYISDYCSDLYRNVISNDSRLYMSEDVRKGNEAYLGIDTSGQNNIFPIAVDPTPYHNISRNVQKYKIVSVGRLVKFKSYNLYMVDIVKRLRDDGFDVMWEVYGNGDLKEEMITRIESLGLKDNIRLYGTIDYSRLSDAFASAHVFVGTGTSLVEASLSRVPSIPAIIDDTCGKTYGFFYQLPYHNLGEQLASPVREYLVYELIKQVFLLNSDEYESECNKHYDYASKYALEQNVLRLFEFADRHTDTSRICGYPESKYFIYILRRVLINTVSYMREKLGMPRLESQR